HRSCCAILFFLSSCSGHHRDLHSFPTRRSSDLEAKVGLHQLLLGLLRLGLALVDGLERVPQALGALLELVGAALDLGAQLLLPRSEEHTSELQSRENLVCRLLLEKKKTTEKGDD